MTQLKVNEGEGKRTRHATNNGYWKNTCFPFACRSIFNDSRTMSMPMPAVSKRLRAEFVCIFVAFYVRQMQTELGVL